MAVREWPLGSIEGSSRHGVHYTCRPTRGARLPNVSDYGARGRGFDTYIRRVVSLSKRHIYSPEKYWSYTGNGGPIPT